MYGKLFATLYDGTLRGRAHEILVFTNLLACADRHGVADKHWRAIAEEVGITEDQVRKAIEALEAPDPESRTDAEEGRRLVRVDGHRAWGWQIVNYTKYRAIRNAEDRREQNRAAQAAWRERQKQAQMTPEVPPEAKEHKPSSAETKRDKPMQKEKQREIKEKAFKATSLPTEDDSDFEEFWTHYPSQNWPAVPNPKPGGMETAFTQWLKLTAEEKDRAWDSLEHYKAYLAESGQQTKHCFRYLRDREFDAYQVAPTPRPDPRAGPVQSRNGRNFDAVAQRLGVTGGNNASTGNHKVSQRGLPAGRVESRAVRHLG